MANANAIANLLPTAAHEAWKYSDPAPYLKPVSTEYAPVHIDATNASIQPVSTELFTGQHAVLKSISKNAGGACVQIVPQVSVDGSDPVLVRFSGDVGKSAHGTAQLHVPDNTTMLLIEENTPDTEWVNTVFEISVGKNATLRHYRSLAAWGEQGVRTQSINVTVDRDSRYETFSLVSGSNYNRQEVTVSLVGQNAEAAVFALHLLSGKRLADHTVLVRHMAPNCRSDQFIRSVILDQAHGVFQGKIFVDKEGQQTDGYQMSNSLLLSPLARMDVKPELEIYADDVRCSHGSTSGPLQGEALFYLQSRGLDKKSAQRLLCTAFIGEVVERLGDKEQAAKYLKEADLWLDQML